MKVYTTIPIEALETLKTKGVYAEDECTAEELERYDRVRYLHDFLVEKLTEKSGHNEDNIITYGSYLTDGENKEPYTDGFSDDRVLLTLEVPENEVLLVDDNDYVCAFNSGFLDNATNEAEYEKQHAWFDSLTPEEQAVERKKSYEHMLDITPFENAWISHGKYVLAIFWNIKKEYVINVKYVPSEDTLEKHGDDTEYLENLQKGIEEKWSRQ